MGLFPPEAGEDAMPDQVDNTQNSTGGKFRTKTSEKKRVFSS